MNEYRVVFTCAMCGKKSAPYEDKTIHGCVAQARDEDWTVFQSEFQGEWRSRCLECTVAIDETQALLMEGGEDA